MPRKFDSVEEQREYHRNCYKNSEGKYKDKVIARKKKNQLVLRQYIWDYLKEHPCVDCGESDPVVLEFDHLSEKKMEIGAISTFNPSLESLKVEIEKCEVRCANCHRKKTAIQLEWYQNIIK